MAPAMSRDSGRTEAPVLVPVEARTNVWADVPGLASVPAAGSVAAMSRISTQAQVPALVPVAVEACGPVVGRINTVVGDAAPALAPVQAAASGAAGALPALAPGKAPMSIHRPKAAIRVRRTSRATTCPMSLRRR